MMELEHPVRGNQIKIVYVSDAAHFIGRGGSGQVFHACWPKKDKCIALKYCDSIPGNRELEIFQYFATLAPNQKNHIIGIYGYKRTENAMFFALELAGASLVAYYNHNSSNVVNQFDFLYNILKGAASALEQFNRHAIHFDIKQANFVVALGQNVANPVVSVKLIDFNRSILLTNTSNVDFRTLLGMFIAPEIRGHNRNMEFINQS
uniref:Protein kinase domain-containing protein n=1 Tax=Meloidogyne enterolobii TaxID=390850 RepID=A0A6V7UDG7_MELEN|nr:unnamed protein product [Meloidogyne enterolobii]